jgi:hypothetical protein
LTQESFPLAIELVAQEIDAAIAFLDPSLEGVVPADQYTLIHSNKVLEQFFRTR